MKKHKNLLVIGLLVLLTCAISIGAYYIENNKKEKNDNEVCTVDRC